MFLRTASNRSPMTAFVPDSGSKNRGERHGNWMRVSCETRDWITYPYGIRALAVSTGRGWVPLIPVKSEMEAATAAPECQHNKCF
jgi:hypothetical protein